MSRRLRTRRTRWAAAAAAALALAGTAVYVAAPANAATTVIDGFEGNPYDRWQDTHKPGDSFVLLGEHAGRHGGSNAAHFHVLNNTPAQVSRQMTVDRPSGSPVTCYGQAYIKKGDTWPVTDTNPRVRLGVRRTDGTPGVYLDLSTYTLTKYEWARANFATFAYSQADLTVDITALGSGIAAVDDVSVWCEAQIR